MNSSHNEADPAAYLLALSGLDKMTQSKNQVDNVAYHAYIAKIHFITWMTTLFDAYINHEVFGIANDDDDDDYDDDKTASFTLVLFNFQSY